MRRIPLLTAVVACAPPPTAPAAAEPPSPIAERIAADPIWRPGDTDPVERETPVWEDHCPEGSATCNLQGMVLLRNRCAKPVRFVVGPKVAAPPADAPLSELAPDEAIHTWIPMNYIVYAQDGAGSYTLRAGVSRHLLFLGQDSCDRVSNGEDGARP